MKFAEVYNKCAKKLQGLHLQVGNQGNQSGPSKPGKMTLRALGSVAAAGVATVSVSSITDELLRDTKLPRIPCIRSQQIGKMVTSCSLDKIPSMILFDLLCSSCKTWEMCNNMIEILKSSLQLDSQKYMAGNVENTDGLKSKQEVRIRSIPDFVSVFESLLQLGNESDTNSHPLNVKDIYVMLYKHSISTFLQTANLPLTLSECMAYANLITEMKKAIEKVDHTFQLHGRMPLEGYIHRSLPKASPRASPKTSPSPRTEDMTHLTQPVLHNAMKQLILVMQRDLPPGGVCTHLSRYVTLTVTLF